MSPRFCLTFLILITAILGSSCKTTPASQSSKYSHFIGLTNFSDFVRHRNNDGETILISPLIHTPYQWNELVVSWNASAPSDTYLEIKADADSETCGHEFFSLGKWTATEKIFSRASKAGQSNDCAAVHVDTLVLAKPSDSLQIEIHLGGTNDSLPKLKLIGLSFCDTRVHPKILSPNHAAWGKTIPVVERSQQSYPGGNGWCSPTSLSMVLAYWGAISNRADWNMDAPEVAAGVIDHNFKKATGNWSFNTAFAGSLDGMGAYVTRFSDISELEDWITAGIPVIISARYDLLKDGRADDFNGHLTVCRGFTENGDLIINDPWTDTKVESIRHIYKRNNVLRAWATSHNTVYLVYPENSKLPPDRFGHWLSQ
jgi:hypothetical protein